jgi:rSAM/selenodomain-associated transferase 1
VNADSEQQLIVFVKAPRPGLVKTRLADALGPARACVIYRQLLERLLECLRSLGPVELRFTPDDAFEEIQPWLAPQWRAASQDAGNLGERIERAFADAFSADAKRVAVIGSDCPDVSAQDIETAWAALRTFDVVLGPATDGGYWLIGLRGPQSLLFRNMPWSSAAVLQETLSRARTAGLRVHLLRELSDVDTVEGWKNFLGRTDQGSAIQTP